MKKSITGLVAAPHTAFHADGGLALEAIPRQAQLLAHNGVAGAFVCGTTGEGPSLTSDERRRVMAAWTAAKPPSLAVFVHVGHLSLNEARELARHAQECGADAIASIAPSFFRPATVVELIDWCARVAQAAPKLPFYYYHLPAWTGVDFAMADFLASVNGQIPTLAGIKYSHPDLADFSRATELAAGKYELLFGCDEILLSGLAKGARGAIGSTYNFAAPLYQRIIAAFGRGDMESAQRDQKRAAAMVDVLARHGGLAAGKAVMQWVGCDCGPVRPPLRQLSLQDQHRLHDDLDRVGFFEYSSRDG